MSNNFDFTSVGGVLLPPGYEAGPGVFGADSDDGSNVWNFGYYRDPRIEEMVREHYAVQFENSLIAELAEDIPDEVFLWKFYEQVTGKKWVGKNQKDVGSCVSFGTNTAIERTMTCEIASGEQEFYWPLVEEITYGGSRVEVGGGRIRGDGSNGSWAAKFCHDWGVVARKKYPSVDLTEYSTSLCRQYGSKGVPDEFEVLAKEHPATEIMLVKSWEEGRKLLAAGYGIAVCSNRGFTMTRDNDGFCRPSGSWAHCMCIDGYTRKGRSGGHIDNSWSESAFKGPVGAGDPSSSGFWAEDSVIDGMIRQGDTWAFARIKGFPPMKLRHYF